MATPKASARKAKSAGGAKKGGKTRGGDAKAEAAPVAKAETKAAAKHSAKGGKKETDTIVSSVAAADAALSEAVDKLNARVDLAPTREFRGVELDAVLSGVLSPKPSVIAPLRKAR